MVLHVSPCSALEDDEDCNNCSGHLWSFERRTFLVSHLSSSLIDLAENNEMVYKPGFPHFLSFSTFHRFRTMILTGLSTLSLLFFSVCAQLLKNGGLTDERPTYDSPEDAEYKLVEPKLSTPWTEGVAADPENAWAEYPRPLLRRDSDAEWLNLNGVWEFQIASGDSETLPSNQTLAQRILVPFCIECVILFFLIYTTC